MFWSLVLHELEPPDRHASFTLVLNKSILLPPPREFVFLSSTGETQQTPRLVCCAVTRQLLCSLSVLSAVCCTVPSSSRCRAVVLQARRSPAAAAQSERLPPPSLAVPRSLLCARCFVREASSAPPLPRGCRPAASTPLVLQAAGKKDGEHTTATHSSGCTAKNERRCILHHCCETTARRVASSAPQRFCSQHCLMLQQSARLPLPVSPESAL